MPDTAVQEKLYFVFKVRQEGARLGFAFIKSPFTNTGKKPLFCSKKVHITQILRESLRKWEMMEYFMPSDGTKLVPTPSILRCPEKLSRCSLARLFRPLRMFRLTASATGGIRLCIPLPATRLWLSFLSPDGVAQSYKRF